MIRHLCISVCLAFVGTAIPLRAANTSHLRMDRQNLVVWTNGDLEKLRSLGLISIVGRIDEERPTSASVPAPYAKTQAQELFAEQAAKLREELEHGRAQLREYRQALEDAQSLRKTTGGINLDGSEIGITPEAGIEILQQRVDETQTELDALEDLARRNYIPPGALRGQ
jgi:hypothetical protein